MRLRASAWPCCRSERLVEDEPLSASQRLGRYEANTSTLSQGCDTKLIGIAVFIGICSSKNETNSGNFLRTSICPLLAYTYQERFMIQPPQTSA